MSKLEQDIIKVLRDAETEPDKGHEEKFYLKLDEIKRKYRGKFKDYPYEYKN